MPRSETIEPAATNNVSAVVPESGQTPWSNTMSARRFWLILAAIGGIGLVLRLAILEEFVRVNPIAERPWADAWVYWQMAGRMAAGEWTDGRPFLSAPLYPCLLGILRRAGGNLVSVYVIQLAIHMVTAALIAWVTRIRFGGAAGLLGAGVFLALTEPALSTTRTLANTIQVFLVALLWWRWVVLEQRGHRRRDIAVAGALIGLLALSYPPAMLLIPAYGLWLWISTDGVGRAWLRAGAGVLSAILLIAPATIHNAVVSGEFVPLCANEGINLRLGNGPGAHGIGQNIPDIRPRRELMFEDAARVFQHVHGRRGTWREIDRHFRNEALRYIWENPLAALHTVALKIRLFASGRNYDEMMSTVIEREAHLARRAILAPLATPWLMGAALVGLITVLRHPIRYTPEWLLYLLPLVTVAVFFYTARYRLPAVPVMCGLTGHVLVHWRRFRAPKPLVLAAVLLPVPLYLLNLVQNYDSPDMQRSHYMVALSEGQVMVGELRAGNKQYPQAEERFRSAIELWNESFLAHLRLGQVLAQQRELDEAIEHFSTAIRIRPDSVQPRIHLYNALCLQKQYEQAGKALRGIVRIAPGNSDVRLALAWLLATCPDTRVRNGEAALRLVRAIQQAGEGEQSAVLDVLAAAYAELGKFEQAVTVGSSAVAIARQQRRDADAVVIERRVERYRTRNPCRAAPLLVRPTSPPGSDSEHR